MGRVVRAGIVAALTAGTLAGASGTASASAAPAVPSPAGATVYAQAPGQLATLTYDARGRLAASRVQPRHEHGAATASSTGGATSPSCVNEGGYSRSTLNGTPYGKWKVTPTFRINLAGMPSTLTATSFKNAIAAAETAWETAANDCGAKDVSGYAGTRGTDTTATPCVKDGINSVGFRRVTSPPTGLTFIPLALTCTWHNQTDPSGFDEVDIYFNTYFRHCSNLDTPDCYDVQSTATHEFGHFVGLGHPSDQTSVMGGPSARRLSLGDVEGVARTYPNSVPLYAATYVSRTIDNPTPGTPLSPLHGYSAHVVVTNSGGLPWRTNNGRVRLATAPSGRVSNFRGFDWISSTRASYVDSSNFYVEPGENASFDFELKPDATRDGTTTTEDFQLVAEGVATMSVNIPAYSLVTGRYAGSVVGQSPFVALVQGVQNPAYVDVQNTGDTAWYRTDAVVTLGTAGPRDRCSAHEGNDWISCRRPGPYDSNLNDPNSLVVLPGQVARFGFNMTAPVDPFQVGQRRTEAFEPLAEGVNWFGSTATFDFALAASSR